MPTSTTTAKGRGKKAKKPAKPVKSAQNRHASDDKPHLFKPGQSGNPGGRPKKYGIFVANCREHTQEALDAILDVLRSGKDKDRLTAAGLLLDRAWGKALTRVEMETHTEKVDGREAAKKLLERFGAGDRLKRHAAWVGEVKGTEH